jgi:thioesterase DpgC
MWATSSVVPRIMCDYPYIMGMDARSLYDELTAQRTRFVRVDELCRVAAEKGALPPADELAAEARLPLKEKRGLEKAQGAFVAEILADPAAGTHLCHAMLLPHPRTAEKMAEFDRTGRLELPGARLERQGKAAVVTMRNPRYLNAEDESTLEGLEIAVDLALLDRKTEVCVLRGDFVDHPKHAGRRLFGAGINLTHLYQGRIRYLWYLIRDLGLVNKLYRGVAFENESPEKTSVEKVWIAAVEGFAIGGHCQILLTIDHTLAAEDAYLTLPARKEGIIPGAANLRLPRFVGDRIARQAIMAELRIECASAAGRMICDEIISNKKMDEAVNATVEKLTGSGVVSAAGNRRAIRAGQEPLDLFRRYMAVYAREQAHCHFSPALVANLEKNWKVS